LAADFDVSDLFLSWIWMIWSSGQVMDHSKIHPAIHPSSSALRQGAQYPQDAVVILGPPLATADEHLATEGLRGVFVVGFGPDAVSFPSLDGEKNFPMCYLSKIYKDH